MTPSKYVDMIVSGWKFVSVDDNIYLIDTFHIKDGCGVWNKYTANSLKAGIFDGVLPNIYIDEYFKWLADDELHNTYMILPSHIEELRKHVEYAEWYDYLNKLGYSMNDMEFLRVICKVLLGTYKFDGEVFMNTPTIEELQCINEWEAEQNKGE